MDDPSFADRKKNQVRQRRGDHVRDHHLLYQTLYPAAVSRVICAGGVDKHNVLGLPLAHLDQLALLPHQYVSGDLFVQAPPKSVEPPDHIGVLHRHARPQCRRERHQRRLRSDSTHPAAADDLAAAHGCAASDRRLSRLPDRDFVSLPFLFMVVCFA